jgi:hypothetical protein
VGGRFVGEADGDGLLEVLAGVGVPDAAGALLAADPPGPAVRTGSSPREASHQPPTRSTATAPAPSRTQKPVSGSGVPVPGWV